MDITESLTLVVQMIAPAFFDLLGLAAFGALFIATLNQLVAQSKAKAFHDKYAQQTASMGLLFLGLTVIVVAIAAIVAVTRMPWLGQWLLGRSSPFLPFYATAGLGVILYVSYVMFWKKFRKHKLLHILLGILTCALLFASLIFCVAALCIFGITSAKTATTLQVATYPTFSHSIFWPLVAQFTFFAIGAAAGISLVYLVLRRNKDDYGRDYYKFALPLAARGATGALLLGIVCQGWIFGLLSSEIRTLILHSGMGVLWSAVLGISILCCLLWSLLARTANPMRMKWVAFVGACLLWVIHSFNCAFSLGLVSML